MKRSTHRFLAVLAILPILLSGCMAPVGPVDPGPTDVPEPVDYSLVGAANVVPEVAGDPYPLFVGARWIYRNTASDWNPQIGASGLVESEIVAEVQGNDKVCYILHTRYSNGPDEHIFLHRMANQVTVEGSRTVISEGAQSSLTIHPSLTYLQFPLFDGKVWTVPLSGGLIDVEVLHQEVIAIENGITSLLGMQPAIFTNAWRVHYHLIGDAPAFFGGPVQFLWFVPGVGMIKHVLNSVDYELVEYRERSEVLVLTEDDDRGTEKIAEGGIVTVQLRGGAPGKAISGGWTLDSYGEELTLIKTAFYDDLADVAGNGSGTYVFTFRATQAGTADLEFTRFNQDNGIVEGDFDVRVIVE